MIVIYENLELTIIDNIMEDYKRLTKKHELFLEVKNCIRVYCR